MSEKLEPMGAKSITLNLVGQVSNYTFLIHLWSNICTGQTNHCFQNECTWWKSEFL